MDEVEIIVEGYKAKIRHVRDEAWAIRSLLLQPVGTKTAMDNLNEAAQKIEALWEQVKAWE